MNDFRKCDAVGCENEAICHIRDGGEVHFCEFHATQALKSMCEIPNPSEVTKSFSIVVSKESGAAEVTVKVKQSTVMLIPEEEARKHCIVPLNATDETLVIAIGRFIEHGDFERIRFIANRDIAVVSSTEQSVQSAIEIAYEE